MKWTTSQVIAALAVLSPILTSWITNRFKLSNTRLNFKQAKVRREERRIDDLEKSFEDYVKSTYLEINSTRIKFSENHNEIEAKLLIYANDELYKAITDFHWFIANNQSSKCRNKELRKIIVLFNKQLNSEQTKRPLLLRKLHKSEKTTCQTSSKQQDNSKE